MANLKNLSIPNISANDTALQLNGDLSFKHLSTNAEHMEILPDTVLTPDQQGGGMLTINNSIFSNSTSLRFGSLSSNVNINIRVPAGDDSGVLFKNTHSDDSIKTLCSFSSYHIF